MCTNPIAHIYSYFFRSKVQNYCSKTANHGRRNAAHILKTTLFGVEVDATSNRPAHGAVYSAGCIRFICIMYSSNVV